jgi:hypothetical protein
MTKDLEIASEVFLNSFIYVNECDDAFQLGDTNIFRSGEAAARFMEPTDVLANEYFVYSASGKRLTPKTDGKTVWIEECDDTNDYIAVIKNILYRHTLEDGSINVSN